MFDVAFRRGAYADINEQANIAILQINRGETDLFSIFLNANYANGDSNAMVARN